MCLMGIIQNLFLATVRHESIKATLYYIIFLFKAKSTILRKIDSQEVHTARSQFKKTKCIFFVLRNRILIF